MQRIITMGNIQEPNQTVNICAKSILKLSSIILSYLFFCYLGFRTFFFAWL